MNQHVWKPILGYEGRYEVSSLGKIRSVPRRVYGGVKNRTWRDIEQKEISQHEIIRTTVPYKQVCLWIGQKGKSFSVHRLVLEAFVGVRPAGMQACHNNGNSLDNRIENLRWDTAKANVSDIEKHGRRRIGSSNPKSKLTAEQVMQIRASSEPASKLAKYYRVSDGNIRHIREGKIWKHLLK